MKDKEIIIDGVDVAGCGYFCEADNECNICGMGTSGEDTFCKNCKNNSNCYYKQLKRLEFELKVTKADYEASEQENKELKAENERLKSCLEIQRTDETKQYIKKVNFERENFKLKAENDRLKSRKDKYYQQTLDYEIQINELYQTLQEIKAIVCGNYEIIDPQGRKDILKLITKAESEG